MAIRLPALVTWLKLPSAISAIEGFPIRAVLSVAMLPGAGALGNHDESDSPPDPTPVDRAGLLLRHQTD